MTCRNRVKSVLLIAFMSMGGSALADYDMGIAAREAGNYTVALPMLSAALTHGDLRAAMVLGEMHENGEGTAVNLFKACEYYLKAAETENVEAQFRTGECLRSGMVITTDRTALEWLQLAADNGYTEAHCAIGMIYESGIGVIRDDDQALVRCLRGAEAGDVEAMETVADWYWRSVGIERDVDRSVYWFVRAVEGGSIDAAWSLGLKYKLGDGDFEPDAGKSTTLLTIAFNGGKVRAATVIADLLFPLATRADGSIDPRVALVTMYWAGLSARIDESDEIRSRSRFIYDQLAIRASGIVPDAERMIEEWLRRNPGVDQTG
ncbi:MAG: tetratricopeptide repeat protein [Alphaproteobacteria bacterium]|nr:tetratricopeptide repeat protein [Alphaproteobacteria bacterium]